MNCSGHKNSSSLSSADPAESRRPDLKLLSLRSQMHCSNARRKSSNPTPSARVAHTSPAAFANEVQQFLQNCGLDQYYCLFSSNEITDLDTFCELKEDHLASIGIPVGHRLRILRRIREHRYSDKTRLIQHSPAVYGAKLWMRPEATCSHCSLGLGSGRALPLFGKLFCSTSCAQEYVAGPPTAPDSGVDMSPATEKPAYQKYVPSPEIQSIMTADKLGSRQRRREPEEEETDALEGW